MTVLFHAVLRPLAHAFRTIKGLGRSTSRAPRQGLVRAGIAVLVVSAMACDSPTQPGAEFDPTDAIALTGGSALVFENATQLAGQRAKIEEVVSDTLTAAAALLPLDGITIIAAAGTAMVIPEIGIGGSAQGGTVRLTFDPSSPGWVSSLDTELFPLLAHELHHVARIRTVGYGDDLLGAMISEGLADRFAIELAGIQPPIWSVALTPAQLTEWSARARDSWFDTGYDHGEWFFGTSGAVPRWAGYSIGFDLTGRFLAANPGRRASDLHTEPATSFIPPGASS